MPIKLISVRASATQPAMLHLEWPKVLQDFDFEIAQNTRETHEIGVLFSVHFNARAILLLAPPPECCAPDTRSCQTYVSWRAIQQKGHINWSPSLQYRLRQVTILCVRVLFSVVISLPTDYMGHDLSQMGKFPCLFCLNALRME